MRTFAQMNVPTNVRNLFKEDFIKGVQEKANYLGALDNECQFCKALFFKCEGTYKKKSWHFSKCCQNGTVQLDKISYPSELKELQKLDFFRTNTRLYNNLFAFTNNFANFDKKMLNTALNKGAYTFRLRGKVSHSIPPTLLPQSEKKPMFS